MENIEKINEVYRTRNINEFVSRLEELSVEDLEKIMANAIAKQKFEIASIIRDMIGVKKQTW